jgi:hypothetical protein
MDKENSISDFFSDLTEPRDSNKRHKLIDIITLGLCAVICDAERVAPGSAGPLGH